MEQNNKYIEELIEKFFEGSTNNAEEKELYNFFSKDNVPANLMKYKPVFHYLECEIENETKFSEEGNAIVGIDGSETKTKKPPLNKWILTIAASLVLLLGAKVYVDLTAFNPYEGSYILRDGVVITDRSEIEAEQQRLEKYMKETIACLNKPATLAEQQIEMYEELEEELQLQIENIEKSLETTKQQKYENK